MAYSSVAQAGYLLIGVAVGSIQGAEAVIYYLVAYTAMTMAAFAVIDHPRARGGGRRPARRPHRLRPRAAR